MKTGTRPSKPIRSTSKTPSWPAREAEAFRQLEINPHAVDLQAVQRAVLWFVNLEKNQLVGQNLTLIEHTGLLYIHQNDLLGHSGEEDIEARMIEVLRRSRSHFLGRSTEAGQATLRLPNSVLKRSSREHALFHQAVFHGDRLRLFKSFSQLYQDYFFDPKDATLIVILLAAIAFSRTVQILSLAFVVAYAFSSFMEYLVHLHIAHAGTEGRARLKKWGSIGRDMLSFSVEHRTHHGIVNLNHIQNVHTEDQKENKRKIDESLLKRGGERLLTSVKNSQYGLSSSNILRTHLFFLPFSIFSGLLLHSLLILFGVKLGLGLASIFYVLFVSTAQIWITTSAIYHPYLHVSRKQIDDEAPWILKIIFKTRLSRFIARSHKTHHSLGGDVNQNLILGFDYLVGWTPVSVADLLELKRRDVYF